MKSTTSSIIIFVLLMLFGALLLIAREREISTYELGETVPPGSEREVVLRSANGPILERDVEFVYCVGDDNYVSDEPFQERVLSDEAAYFGVAYVEQRPGSELYDWYYSFDRTSLYYNCERVEGVDPNNMVMFKYNFGSTDVEPETYVYSNNSIYYKDSLYMMADAETLEQQPELRDAIENTVFATE